MPYTTTHQTPLGPILLAADENGLTGLWLANQKYHGAGLGNNPTPKADWPVFAEAKAWLEAYFAGQKPAISALPLSLTGSPFRKQVWDILCSIPYGQCITYGGIAQQMAAASGLERMSAQAVGGAVGHNPISIIIPCHRVIGTGGSLTGYAGGVAAKRFLLAHEGVDVTQFSVPKKGTAL